MKAYGAVIINGVEYDNEDDDERGLFIIFDHLQPDTPLKYGVDWHYAGDLDVDECEIYVDCGGEVDRVFAGETGLNEFVKWYYSQQ